MATAKEVKELAHDLGIKVYEGYSGRGMFGRQCIGVVVDDPDYIKRVVDDYDLPIPVTDNLGLSYICYWPKIKG